MSSQIHSRITGKARESLVQVLDHVLKDECSLLATTRDYRESVKGPNIYSRIVCSTNNDGSSTTCGGASSSVRNQLDFVGVHRRSAKAVRRPLLKGPV